MVFTDFFIRRPVFAIVVNVLLLIFGLRAVVELQLRQYPEMEIGQLVINTAYPGADSELVQGFVTTPIQEVIRSVEGIDYIKASSRNSLSSIEVFLELGYDADTAVAEMLSKINEVRSELPSDILDSVITKANAGNDVIMWIAYQSSSMGNAQITDYLRRVVQSRLMEIQGIAGVMIGGGNEYAMRIWLDPVKMQAFGVGAADVNAALLENNFQAAAGEVRNSYTITSIRADTSLQDEQSFRDIIVKSDGRRVVRLQDVARIELDTGTQRQIASFQGKSAVYMGVRITPNANPLVVSQAVREMLPEIEKDLPAGLRQHLNFDRTVFIEESIKRVLTTLLEAIIIVILVVFLFLGSPRSVVIPLITIPLSLIGVALFMLMAGYSLNLLTLLAMVMAISLVVDDAIVVMENVYRHIEEGLAPLRAAVIGAREIAMPIVAMTITLAAVYTPIGFMGGLTGSLFTEFAFTLAGAVLISGFIALTLSPVMSGRILDKKTLDNRLVRTIDRFFHTLKSRYERLLGAVLENYRLPVTLGALIIFAAIGVMFTMTQSELAPNEDQGFVLVSGFAQDNANVDYVQTYTEQIAEIFSRYPEHNETFAISGMPSENFVFSGMVMHPWDERERTVAELQPEVQAELDRIAGIEAFTINPPVLPGTASGLPVNFVILTAADYGTLYDVAEEVRQRARESGMFAVVNNSLRLNRPQIHVRIDRVKAGQMGISMRAIGRVLATHMGDFRSNFFDMQGRSYEVIPQSDNDFRQTQEAIEQLYVPTLSGDRVPLSTIVSVAREVVPNSRTQFQLLNSATIEALPQPGVATIADAHEFLRETLQEVAPEGFMVDYGGQSRQFEQEGGALMITFILALLVIYLVLAAQFESFRDPFVILLAVPLSIFGAMIPLFLGYATMNIYTQVGLITLIGLITKHGILIVEFANQLQRSGKDRLAAVREAAAIRLRPILMTTAAMVLGVMPLVLAEGAGAIARNNIGLVITVGLGIGTLFTLFVIPVMYSLLAKTYDRELALERAEVVR